MTKVKGVLVVGASIIIAVLGIAAAVMQAQARVGHVSDDVARKLDTVASLLMDAEGNERAASEVAAAARELLAIQTVLAGQELNSMDKGARERTLVLVRQIGDAEGLSLIADERIKDWAEITRTCMLSNPDSRQCGVELPAEIDRK